MVTNVSSKVKQRTNGLSFILYLLFKIKLFMCAFVILFLFEPQNLDKKYLESEIIFSFHT